MQQLYEIDCEPICGFKVISHDKDEAVMIAKEHAKRVHNKDYTDEEVEGMIKEV